jgi:hypothetical protein
VYFSLEKCFSSHHPSTRHCHRCWQLSALVISSIILKATLCECERVESTLLKESRSLHKGTTSIIQEFLKEMFDVGAEAQFLFLNFIENEGDKQLI